VFSSPYLCLICSLGFTGRHGTYENGRYGVAFSRQPDSSAIRSSENGKAERDTFILSGGYVSSPNADKYIKDIDGLHFRDTHISPVDVRAALSPQYDPSPRNGSQSSFEALGSRDGERMKSASSRYSWSLNHRDQDFREKNVSRPDNYRRVCHLPKLDSSREWSVENKDVLEGRIDRYGSASNREPLYSEVYKDQSHKEWRNKDRGLYNGLPSRISSYPSKSHSRDLGIVSPRSEILGATSLFEDQMVQNPQMHELNAEESVPNSKKRPRLTWGQGLAKYEKEKIEEDPSSQKKYDEVKILEANPSCQKKSEDITAEGDPSIQEKVVVDSEEHCKQNEGFQSQLALPCADQVVNAGKECFLPVFMYNVY
jgi:nuclear receptor co-repressor 1